MNPQENNFPMQEDDDEGAYVDEEEEEEEEEEEQTTQHFTSIWDMVGSSQSPLDAMLAEENLRNTSLYSVLDEDTLLQELKTPNTKVVDYLSKTENIIQMLKYLTTRYYQEDFENETNNAEKEKLKQMKDSEKERILFKFPYIVSEIIACNNDEINEAIVESEENIMLFLSFLIPTDEEDLNNRKTKTLVNASLPSYFSRALSSLVQNNYCKITAAIMKQNNADVNIIQKLFIDNINLVEMNSVILKLLGIESSEMDSINEQELFSGFGQQKIREFYLNKKKNNTAKIQECKDKMKLFVVENKMFDMMLEALKNNVAEGSANELFSENVVRNIFSVFRAIVESTKANPTGGNNIFGLAQMQLYANFGQPMQPAAASPNSPSMKSNKNLMNSLCSEANMTKLLDILITKNCRETLFVLGLDFLKVVTETFSEYDEKPNRAKGEAPSGTAVDMDGQRAENESDESDSEEEEDDETIKKSGSNAMDTDQSPEKIGTKKKGTKKKDKYLEKRKKAAEDLLHPCVALIVSKTHHFVDLLKEKTEEEEKLPADMEIEQTKKDSLVNYLTSIAPLGEKKLRIVSHFLLLFKIQSHNVIRKELFELKILKVLVDIFFKNPFNNILHTLVLEIFQFVLRPLQQREFLSEKEVEEDEDIQLQHSLLFETDLPLQIARMSELNLEFQQKPRGFRLGIMGHMDIIANSIVGLYKGSPVLPEKPEQTNGIVQVQPLSQAQQAKKEAAQDPVNGAKELLKRKEIETSFEREIREKIYESPGWKEFIENELAPMNVDNNKEIGGPTPINSTLSNFQYTQNSMYQFDDQDDEEDDEDGDEDDEYEQGQYNAASNNLDEDDDEDDDDDSDDDDETIRKPKKGEDKQENEAEDNDE